MIRRAFSDLAGAINLLYKHQARQLMREGEGGEAEEKGVLPQGWRQAIGSADDEGEARSSCLDLFIEEGAEGLASQQLALGIEGDGAGFLRQPFEELGVVLREGEFKLESGFQSFDIFIEGRF